MHMEKKKKKKLICCKTQKGRGQTAEVSSDKLNSTLKQRPPEKAQCQTEAFQSAVNYIPKEDRALR